eukprot:149520_1
MSTSDIQWAVHVDLGPCRVVKDEKGRFTTFTFKFRIGQENHEFTSRYSKLYKFHESLSKNEVFQKAFNYDPPKFPPKSWMTDFTKPKNYKKRAKKLLDYFEILVSKPLVLRDKLFQKGIHLPKALQKTMSQIAVDLQSRKRVIDLFDDDKSQSSMKQLIHHQQQQKQQQQQQQPQQQRKSLLNN